jgi:excisionase family DNA binding protein
MQRSSLGLCLEISMLWDTLYTVTEAAAMLKVSPWTIRAWLIQGKLQRSKIGSRTVIRASELRNAIRDIPPNPRKTMAGASTPIPRSPVGGT